MTRKEIKFGTSASILIYGDSEKITSEIRRGSIPVTHTVIRKHPGLVESIFPSCIDKIGMAPLFASEKQKERIFRSRIKRCFEIDSEIVRRYVEKDNEQEHKILLRQKEEEEERAIFDEFIETVTKGVSP